MAVPFISNDDLERHAESFLARFLTERIVPIPIEEIVEIDLGMEIVPIPGFRARFGVEGYISNDLKTLFVDGDIIMKNAARYRFTLAHEISHYELHGDFIRQEFPANAHDWKERLLQRDPTLHTRLETQANRMAGAILVPRKELIIAWDDVKNYARQQGLDVEEMDEYGISHLAARIARDFNVSGKTVEIALERYGLLYK